MSEKWKEILNKNTLPKIDEQRKRQSIETLKIEIANTEIIVKENYFEKIKRYIPFMNKITFLIQFILLLIGIFVIKSSSFEKTRLILSLVMPILAFLQIMELEKSFKYNMYEIEMSCKMDLKELISIKLLVNSIINLLIMTIFASLTATHFGDEIYLLIIYFLVPFMITNVINIGTMKLSKNKSNEIINIIVTLLMNIILLILNIKFPYIYETSSILIWVGLLCIMVIYSVKTVYQFYEKEEDYIWNLQ
ncbi:MAG: hypothetical protein HFJ20_00610 [Clostridia bacterium]|nr:hypothetical protein [Clostridia bacterium]